MPIVVEGVSLEKYLVWINEGLEGPYSIEGEISAASMLLIYKSIKNKIKSYFNKIKSYQDKLLCYKVRLTKIYKLPLTKRYIFFSIIGLIIIFFPSILSVLFLDWLVDYFTYAYRMIFRDVIMCADFTESGDVKPEDTEYANKYEAYSKNEMSQDIQRFGEVLTKTTQVVCTVAVGKAGVDILSGNIPAVTGDLVVAGGSVLAEGFINIAVDEAKRKINNLPDNHPKDEPASPSAYGDDIYNASIEIPYLRDILEYIQGLDNDIQVMYLTLIFIIIAIYIQLMKMYKNYINKKFNMLELSYNNKYLNLLIKYKNIMNKYSNIYFNIIIGFFLFLSFLGILSLIILF